MPGKPRQHQCCKALTREHISALWTLRSTKVIPQALGEIAHGNTTGQPKMHAPKGEADSTMYMYIWSAVTAYLEYDGILPIKACLEREYAQLCLIWLQMQDLAAYVPGCGVHHDAIAWQSTSFRFNFLCIQSN